MTDRTHSTSGCIHCDLGVPSRVVTDAMDAFTAVFNGHVNDADTRARSVLRHEAPTALARIEQIERDWGGIMAIFDPRFNSPKAARRYADLVCRFVNETAPSIPVHDSAEGPIRCTRAGNG